MLKVTIDFITWTGFVIESMGSYNFSHSFLNPLSDKLAARQKGNALWRNKKKTKSQSESQFYALSFANVLRLIPFKRSTHIFNK